MRAGGDGLLQTKIQKRRPRAEIKQAGLLSEWSGERFVAIDIPPNTEPSNLFAVMESAVNAGDAFREWSSATPFITHT